MVRQYLKELLFVLCLLCILTACVSKVDTPDQEANVPPSSQEAITTSPSSEENSVSSELTIYVAEPSNFSDGVAWVSIHNPEDGIRVSSVCIDTNGNILFKVDPNLFFTSKFENGVSLCETLDGICNIVDKKGMIIFSSKDGLFDGVLAHGDGYFAVYKYKDGFDSAGYDIIFLNSNGERLNGEYDLLDSLPSLTYCGDGIFANCIWQSVGGSGNYVFIDAKSDTYFQVDGINNGSPSFVDGVCLVDIGFWGMLPALIYADGTIKELNIGNYNPDFLCPIADGGFVFRGYYNESQSILFYDIATETVTMLGNYGERVTRWSELRFDSGHLLLPMVGADGKNYYTIVDKSGQSLFDPVTCESAYALGEDRIRVEYKDKTVIYNGKGEIVFELPAGQSVGSYHDGVARLGNSGYVDLNGNVMTLLYDNGTVYATFEKAE